MGEVLADGFSDRGSIPLISIQARTMRQKKIKAGRIPGLFYVQIAFLSKNGGNVPFPKI